MASTYTKLLYHVIFSTKERIAMIRPNFAEELYSYVGGIVRNEKGTLLAIGGMPDHIHMLARFHPSMSVSDMLRIIKAKSSKWVNENYSRHQFSWQRGYSAFTVSQSKIKKVSEHIENQQAHHSKVSFQTELLALLRKHRIEYDERYLWD